MLARPLVLGLMIHYGGPTTLNGAGRTRVRRWAQAGATKDPTRLVDAIFGALARETVVVPGTEGIEKKIPELAPTSRACKPGAERSPQMWRAN